MIDILVVLEVKNAEAFKKFETRAISILNSHKGTLLLAFEADAPISDCPENTELHYIQFPTIDNYNAYRADPALRELADLRSEAIESTKVYVSRQLKNYGENGT